MPDVSCSPIPLRRSRNGSGRDVVLAGANAGTSRWPDTSGQSYCGSPSRRWLRSDCRRAFALRGGLADRSGDDESSIFHDEEIDGPLPTRVRTLVLATDEERPVVVAPLDGYDGVDVVSADDVPGDWEWWTHRLPCGQAPNNNWRRWPFD